MSADRCEERDPGAMSIDTDLVRLLLATADSFEDRSAPSAAGVVRAGARRIVELERQLSRVVGLSREGSCPWCGRPVEQPKTGRPRLYCSSSCRKSASRKTA